MFDDYVAHVLFAADVVSHYGQSVYKGKSDLIRYVERY
jgi:hypothetical protein